MPQETMRELLDLLNTKLQKSEPVAEEDLDMLAEVKANIENLLDENVVSDTLTISEQLNMAVGNLEAEHPLLTGMLVRVINALSDAGF